MHLPETTEAQPVPMNGKDVLPSCRIREVGIHDRKEIAEVARLHMQLLPFGPMSGLGETFVREIGYAAPVRDGRLRIAVCEVDHEIAGYIAFTEKALEYQTKTIRDHWGSVLRILAGFLLRHPHRLGNVWRAAKAATAHRYESETADSLRGEIAASAVSPEYCTAVFYRRMRVRISEELVKYAAASLRRAGMRRLRAFIDADNRAVFMIYHRLGAQFENLQFGGVPTVRVSFDLDRDLLNQPTRS